MVHFQTPFVYRKTNKYGDSQEMRLTSCRLHKCVLLLPTYKFHPLKSFRQTFVIFAINDNNENNNNNFIIIIIIIHE